VKNTSQFYSDVSSSDNDCSLGKIFEVEESIRVESEIVTGNVLGHRRSSTDGDNDSIGRVLTLFVGSSVSLVGRVSRADREGVLVYETSVTGNVFYSVLFDVYKQKMTLQPASNRVDWTWKLTLLVDTVQSLNVLVSLVFESRPIDLGVLFRDGESVRVCLVKLLPVVTST
jgi:hypothetical protein